MEWKTCKISDLAVIISGGTPKTTIESFWNGNIPWLSVKDFSGDSKYVYTTEKTITDEGLKHSTANLLSAQDIVISARGTVGELAMLPFPMSLNQSCFGLRARCDADFLYYLLKVKVAEFKQRANGGVFGTIIRTTFDKVKCRIPDSLECQHRIASILSAYDNLIENNTKRIRLLEKMAENLYKEWFVRFRFPGHENVEMENKLPKGWKISRIKDFGRIETGKTPSTKKSEYYGGKILFVKTPDMHEGFFVSSTEETLSDLGSESQEKKLLPPYSIMVSCIGTGGVVAINAKPAHTNQQINSIILSDASDLEWIFMVCKGLKTTIELFGATGATMTNLSKGKFEKLKVIEPPNCVRYDFHNKTRSTFKLIQELSKQNSLLARRRDLLLPRLMSGKLEVKP